MKKLQYSTRFKFGLALMLVVLLTAIVFVLGSGIPALAQGASISFTADRQVIQAGECVNIRWNVTGVREVYYSGAPVVGENQVRSECPGQTRTYYLEVLQTNGQVVTLPLTIYVEGGQPAPVIRFWSDRTTIRRGECVNISWHVENVREVYYRSRGVVGENQNRIECPKKTRTYDLVVIRRDGQPVVSNVTINVIQPTSPVEPTPTMSALPQPVINYPVEGTEGVPVTFDASESRPGSNPIASYEWDFGDGNTGSGALVEHTYQTAGTYDVTLRVTDTAGFGNVGGPVQIKIVTPQ